MRLRLRWSRCWLGLGLLLGAAQGAAALQVSSLSPQGEVAQVRQVVARFDAPAVNFGDAKSAAPLLVSCNDAQAAQGRGRWISAKEWAFQFADDLPTGTRCTVQAVPGFLSPEGESISGRSRWTFNIGGPFVRRIWPGDGATIDEAQTFALRLSGDATLQSLLDHVHCHIEGLGEQVAVETVTGAAREAVFEAVGLSDDAAQHPRQVAVLRCARRFPSGGRVTLVYGAGVRTPGGVANQVERRFDYRVREPFAANFSCERENVQAGCVPLKPFVLSFNAPVSRKLAEAIRLQAGGRSVAPVLGGEGETSADAEVDNVTFAPPFAESVAMQIVLPPQFVDVDRRPLCNADQFPLKVATGAMPPLAKFATSPFGIVERFAEGVDRGPALLPVTLRKVPLAQGVRDYAVSDLQPQTDAQTLAWFRRVQRFSAFFVSREEARKAVSGPLPPVLHESDGDAIDPDRVQTRMVSLLDGKPGLRKIALPALEGAASRPFEIVGIPLRPGFHVVEIASKTLGRALLDPRYGANREMVVRTAALVTNLNVSVKIGRENALAWVTTLDKGRPVAGAKVQVSNCEGTLLTTATTDAQGIARLHGLDPEAPYCNDEEGESLGYFVSARATGDDGVSDMAFAWSRWNEGFEPWRFDVPTSQGSKPDAAAHTVFDRTLLRAGETVSMKHILRLETLAGLVLPKTFPDTLAITHVGSGQTFKQPLQWRPTPTGGKSASSQFALPEAAKLGEYSVGLQRGDTGQTLESGRFRVEEFRLPVFTGRVVPVDSKPLIRPGDVPVSVQVSYTAGGPAAQLPVQVSALLRSRDLAFNGYEAFDFSLPQHMSERLVADKLAVTLDRQGLGRVTIEQVPASSQASELLLEASYADPNGEIQTLRSTQTVWPAAVVAGIKTERWVSAGKQVKLEALALNLQGRPQADVALAVKGVAHITTTSRKRMVGGFYAYDNQTSTKDLGTLCRGKSDAHGLLRCNVPLNQAGEIELIATATDAKGRDAQAATNVWVTRQGELWFGGENHDRMDVLPEKTTYQPGETAQFQVRMPFRRSTALVAVEREGVMHTEVIQLDGRDPTVRLKVRPEWGPNVYVSVLALRGRLYDVPWYSLFTWGYKTPVTWWRMFWGDSKEDVPPTALVDLSKPAFRFGMAEIRVGTAEHALKVTVQSDKPSYPVRGKARVTITATLPDGKPAAGADVALAGVDQALLELMPNPSWDLLQAMLRRRDWGVATATAQSEIIGRRHYGLKAVPAGGGGGKTETRELFDTLLLWKPDVVLDAQGRAVVDVPLNDSLTTFRIVAVAERGLSQFGTGEVTLRSTQDLQILSGLPPLIREGDRFTAPFTLRNTTQRPMRVTLTPQVAGLRLQAQAVDIPAEAARDVAWTVDVPLSDTPDGAHTLAWQIDARDALHGARDALKVQQQVLAAVPLSVQQATLTQLDGSFNLQVAPPPDGLQTAHGRPRGGVKLALQPTLVVGLDGVRDWLRRYPYGCLEQKSSVALGLMDAARWQAVMASLPSYLDADGLANYFPVREGDGNTGSDVLTAYLLAASDEAVKLDPAFAIPDHLRAQMQAGLAAFVAGRLERKFWAPRADLEVRKLAAIEALARAGKAQPRMLESITLAPNQWPTSAVIDWLSVLQRMPDVPQRAQRQAQAESILKARLSWQGTRLVFSTERDDDWWWLMTGGDVNTARLMLLVMHNPAWRDELPRLASGFITRQQRGAWSTTTANLWGSLALQQFARTFESQPVAGITRVRLGQETGVVDWRQVARPTAASASGAIHAAGGIGVPNAAQNGSRNTVFLSWTSSAAQTLQLQQQGSGKPWVTIQSWAAVPLKAAFDAGYGIKKTIDPVEQAVPGKWTRGDVLRVTLEINASSDMSWVVVSDPIPGGASILGGGMGRDSEIATRGGQVAGGAWNAYEERSFSAFRSYYAYLPKGKFRLQYTLRLNTVGRFALPPTRVEAMYAPEMFGELPHASFSVEARP
ncbi:alpha-2-macroglobulin family protein [Thiomonas intermedia]|uniref:alpha-2-macroglobulin family protein n=1 Tax=Thiomonas intermedia TaxID=926 RepID=UPI0009A4BF17|nr:MG2 domain-containing protein [Thiomonas intermedia]